MASNKEYFSIELRVHDKEAASLFLQQFTDGLAAINGLLPGMPAIEVIGCGWSPDCGSMTACDIYEDALRGEGKDPDEVLSEYLLAEEEA